MSQTEPMPPIAPTTNRIIVYGAGAIGGVIGASLALRGQSVSLVARGAHLDTIQRRGLELHTADGRHTVPLEAVEDPADLAIAPGDVVILAVKTQDSGAALDALSAVAPPDIAVVCAQNGVENERLALRRFAAVYGMCVMLPASHLEPGVVVGAGSPVLGILDIGRYPAGVDQVATDLAAALTDAGFRSRADPEIMRHKYAKLRVNTRNALDAACGPPARGSDLARRASAEALQVFAAAGIEVATRDEEAARREPFTTVEIGGEARSGSSSWQSLAKGRGSIEADYLNGEIVLLGRRHGVPTPVNEALRRLANRMARSREEPGSVSLAEVEALVAGLEEAATG